MRRRGVAKRLTGVGLIAALAVTGTAYAVSTSIETTTLQSNAGTALWDLSNHHGGNLGFDAYTPADDGSITSPRSANDAFDGGLAVRVGSHGTFRRFIDPDGMGNLNGQTITVGPRKLGALKVSRTDSGLSGSPTLRDLVKLQNTKSRPVHAPVILDTNVGSDNSTIVAATSSGDKKVTFKDRWAVTTDNLTTPSDPPVTLVWFGKGAVRSKPATLLCVPGNGSDCAAEFFNVRVPAHATRYLLFFAEMHGDSPSAISSAHHFNPKRLNSALLSGIGQSVRKKVLNWDLG